MHIQGDSPNRPQGTNHETTERERSARGDDSRAAPVSQSCPEDTALTKTCGTSERQDDRGVLRRPGKHPGGLLHSTLYDRIKAVIATFMNSSSLMY